MKLIIAGSRSIETFPSWEYVVKVLLNGRVPTEIISGGAKGPDRMGEMWAQEHSIPVKIFYAPWNNVKNKPSCEIGFKNGKKYWKLAGHCRNNKMAEYIYPNGTLLVFWDGTSTGTRNMINIAAHLQIETIVHKYMGRKKPKQLWE